MEACFDNTKANIADMRYISFHSVEGYERSAGRQSGNGRAYQKDST
jgi:hypothetical protein